MQSKLAGCVVLIHNQSIADDWQRTVAKQATPKSNSCRPPWPRGSLTTSGLAPVTKRIYYQWQAVYPWGRAKLVKTRENGETRNSGIIVVHVLHVHKSFRLRWKTIKTWEELENAIYIVSSSKRNVIVKTILFPKMKKYGGPKQRLETYGKSLCMRLAITLKDADTKTMKMKDSNMQAVPSILSLRWHMTFLCRGPLDFVLPRDVASRYLCWNFALHVALPLLRFTGS